jgi:hypothetical protein
MNDFRLLYNYKASSKESSYFLSDYYSKEFTFYVLKINVYDFV